MTRASGTVVVPTKNAARTLRACLESIARQSVRCGLVIVDCSSVDDSKAIASGFADLVLNTAPNPSLQRNVGARALPADIIGFVDADMVGGEQVVEQIVAGAGSVIVPERSFGESYSAKVRAFERFMYVGILEWPRFFSYDLFEALSGHDEDLIAMEDTDLRLRASTRATPTNWCHDLGKSELSSQIRLLQRYKWFSPELSKLFAYPLHGVATLIMKTAEFASGGFGYVLSGAPQSVEGK